MADAHSLLSCILVLHFGCTLLGGRRGHSSDKYADAFARSWVASHLVGNVGEEIGIPSDCSSSTDTKDDDAEMDVINTGAHGGMK